MYSHHAASSLEIPYTSGCAGAVYCSGAVAVAEGCGLCSVGQCSRMTAQRGPSRRLGHCPREEGRRPAMAELPMGTVTFLFTDIEGSTHLLQRLGASYAEVLATQRCLLRAAFQAHGGQEVDAQGDAFFVAFPRATDAVAAAVAAQQP